jgi:hypothetical protein
MTFCVWTNEQADLVQITGIFLHFFQDRERWLTTGNPTMNLRVRQKPSISRLAEETVQLPFAFSVETQLQLIIIIIIIIIIISFTTATFLCEGV